nr:hypothetical protein [Aliiroseovarius crassostreae]
MARLFKASSSNDLPAHETFDVCPTSQVSVISLMGGARRLSAMCWGSGHLGISLSVMGRS